MTVTLWAMEIGYDLTSSTIVPMVWNASTSSASGLLSFQPQDTISFILTDLTDYSNNPNIKHQTPTSCTLTFQPISPLPSNTMCLSDPSGNNYDALNLTVDVKWNPTGYFYTTCGLKKYVTSLLNGEILAYTFNVSGRFSMAISVFAGATQIATQDPEIFVGAGSCPPT